MSGNIFLEATTVSAREFDGVARIPVSRVDDTSAPTTVEFLVSGVSATDGEDFSATVSSIVIPAGEDRAVIEVPIIDDGEGEPTETFQVSLIRASSGDLLAPRTAIVSILDDETPTIEPEAPPFISDYTVSETEVITGLDQPISVEFTADGERMYVAEKGGVIKLFDAASGSQISTVLDISSKVNVAGDRGLMDIALSPTFEEDGLLYAIYVVDPPETAGQTGAAGPDGIGNRFVYLSRFELNADKTAVIPGSETVLLGGGGQSLSDISGGGALDFTAAEFADNPSSAVDPDSPTGFKRDYWKVDAQSHQGGSLEFGEDGALYVSTGDGGSYNIPDRRNIEVQNIDSLTGKVLRIDPETGLGLPDNPFATDDLGENQSKVYQLGLRNPYTLAIHEGQVILGDTGWGQAEEINIGEPGANFGWPFFEGGDGELWVTPRYDIYPEQQGFFDALARGEFTVTPAFKGFSRSASDPGYQVQAIVGADGVHTGDAYPVSLDDHVFFTDVARTNVFALNLNDRTDVKYLYTTGGIIGPVYFEPSPDGEIHYVDLLNGVVGKLEITEAPLTMALNGSATYDADDGAYRLTGSSGGFYPGTAGSRFQAGSAFSDETIDITADFTMTAQIYLGGDPGGADGMAFVLHSAPEGMTALGANGGSLGAAGIEDGVAIEFDTYAGPGEPVQDHVAIFDTDAGGTVALGPVVEVGQLEDGAWHDLEVTWDASAREMVVTLDGTVVQSGFVDVQAMLAGDTNAYFGFTASTGGVTNEHKVRNIQMDSAASFDAVTTGAAVVDPDGTIRPLGDGAQFSSGAATSTFRIDLDSAFFFEFDYTAGSSDAGGDGFGFAFHSEGTDVLGRSGGNLGLVGLGDALSIEVDLYDNGDAEADIANDHVAAFLGSANESPILAPFDIGNVEDGATHTIAMDWDPGTGALRIFHDGALVGSIDGAALEGVAEAASNTVNLSITGGTGGATIAPEISARSVSAETLSGQELGTKTLGDATGDGSGATLTSDAADVGGLAVLQKIDLSEDFVLEASVDLDGAQADGMAFVLHNDARGSDALGWEGGNLGAGGIADMFAFELDLYDNGSGRADISSDHVGIMKSQSGGWVSSDAVAVDPFVAGEARDVAIAWDVEEGVLSFAIDGAIVAQADEAEVAAALGGSEEAYLTITASTGGLWANHSVTLDEFYGAFV